MASRWSRVSYDRLPETMVEVRETALHCLELVGVGVPLSVHTCTATEERIIDWFIIVVVVPQVLTVQTHLEQD